MDASRAAWSVTAVLAAIAAAVTAAVSCKETTPIVPELPTTPPVSPGFEQPPSRGGVAPKIPVSPSELIDAPMAIDASEPGDAGPPAPERDGGVGALPPAVVPAVPAALASETQPHTQPPAAPPDGAPAPVDAGEPILPDAEPLPLDAPVLRPDAAEPAL